MFELYNRKEMLMLLCDSVRVFGIRPSALTTSMQAKIPLYEAELVDQALTVSTKGAGHCGYPLRQTCLT